MKLIIATFMFTILSACAASNTRTFLPSESTGYYGVMYVDPIESLLDYETTIEGICKRTGRLLDKNSLNEIATNAFGGKSVRYYCWGSESRHADDKDYNSGQSLAAEIPSTPSPQKNTGSNDVKNEQSTPPEAKKDAFDSNQQIKLKLEDAKSKCISLGFKPKTEKFGNCVMELSK